MIPWLLKQLEQNPTSIFRKRDLLKQSEKQFKELRRLGFLTYVQPDPNRETYPCSLPCANTCPMDVIEMSGRLFAICPQDSEVNPIPLDRNDLDKYKFCLEKFLEKVRTANRLSGVLHRINQDYWYFGYKTYKDRRVGFIFGFTIIHKSMLELTGLKHLCAEDDFLVVFSPVSVIDDISHKRELDRERVIQTSLASSLDFQIYEFSVEKLLLGSIAREVEKEQKTKPLKEWKVKKRGRPRKYTDDQLNKMRNAYEQFYQETNDSKAAWSKVANFFSVKSGDAARIACIKHRKKFEKK